MKFYYVIELYMNEINKRLILFLAYKKYHA